MLSICCAHKTAIVTYDYTRPIIRDDRHAIALANAGYEVEGLEKLPLAGPALIVYYHGTMPVDMYYLLSEYLLRRKRLIRCVTDRCSSVVHILSVANVHLVHYAYLGFCR